MVSRPSGLLSYFFLLALSQGMCPEVGEEGRAGLSSQRVWGGIRISTTMEMLGVGNGEQAGGAP